MAEPILTIPHRAFLAALNCLRNAQLSKRRAALDAVKDQSLVDPATTELMERFGKLDEVTSDFLNMLESTDYGIPETVKGVVSIRQLVSVRCVMFQCKTLT